jgi:hypothetical protein
MADFEKKEQVEHDVNVKKENISRNENPSLVGATFIKYAAYIIILVIILYFVLKYVFPMI